MKPGNQQAVIERVRYDTEKATLLCGDDYWDGHNFERHGRNSFLYRTTHGRYFFQHLSQWQGESDTIEPCSEDEAIEFFESCLEDDQRVTYEKAFPKVEIKEA